MCAHFSYVAKGFFLATALLSEPLVAARSAPPSQTVADRQAKDMLRHIDGQVGVMERSRTTITQSDRVLATKTDQAALDAIAKDNQKAMSNAADAISRQASTKGGPVGDADRLKAGKSLGKAISNMSEKQLVDYENDRLKAAQDRKRAFERLFRANTNAILGTLHLAAMKGLSPKVAAWVQAQFKQIAARSDKALKAGGPPLGRSAGRVRESRDHEPGLGSDRPGSGRGAGGGSTGKGGPNDAGPKEQGGPKDNGGEKGNAKQGDGTPGPHTHWN